MATLQVVNPPELPELILGVDLERVTNDAIVALAKDVRVFQRSGQLVGVVSVVDGPPLGKLRRSVGAPIIRSLAMPTLRERLASAAKWRRFDKKSKGYVPSLPPDVVVSGVAARGEWVGVRPLVSVVTSPCLKPDGQVLQAPGYDADTATLFSPREAYVAVPPEPTLEDARGAVLQIREVVCDFPFARPEHESAWIAGLLTMLARPAIAGPCPMFAVDATTRGTGKSRLVDAAVRIATGLDAARTAMPDDDDEMRKRITALMLEGDPAVCVDNITRAITLPSLDNVLTATTWKDRMLGVTGNVTVPARAVWWATGNNLILGGDLSRRTVHIRLESPLENPEERSNFKHANLLSWIGENRSRLVAAALTILRAYAFAGYPVVQCGRWGSYEDWSRIVPAALVWAGMPDPLLARATQAVDAEPEVHAIRVFLHGVRYYLDNVGRNSFGTRELLDHIYDEEGNADLRESTDILARASNGKHPTSLQLSGVLRRHRGRVLDQMRIAGVGLDSHVKSAQWTVERLGDRELTPNPPAPARTNPEPAAQGVPPVSQPTWQDAAPEDEWTL